MGEQSAASQEHSKTERIEFLRQKLIENMEDFDWEARKARRRAFSNKIAIAACGALTTFLIGLQANELAKAYALHMSAAALFFSALVPIFTAWDAFYDHRWQWVQKTMVHRTLAGILYDLEYETSGHTNVPDSTIEALYRRLRSTFDESNRVWQEKRNAPTDIDIGPGAAPRA
ncbi:SLATT domain-containing protein [Sinorhizobium medicae]|nr:SLATT domain-containing protein [Sinorhizobium medicae]